jgi:hypothetical protein
VVQNPPVRQDDVSDGPLLAIVPSDSQDDEVSKRKFGGISFGFAVECLISLRAIDPMKSNAFWNTVMRDRYGVSISDRHHLARNFGQRSGGETCGNEETRQDSSD